MASTRRVLLSQELAERVERAAKRIDTEPQKLIEDAVAGHLQELETALETEYEATADDPIRREISEQFCFAPEDI